MANWTTIKLLAVPLVFFVLPCIWYTYNFFRGMQVCMADNSFLWCLTFSKWYALFG